MNTFIIDSNVFLHDPNCFKSFQNSELVIPLPVLDELDKIKNRPDEIGRNARVVVRFLDGLRAYGSLNQGIQYDTVFIRVELNHQEHISGLNKSIDNRIISVALGLQKEGKSVKVISKDINLRVKCDALGIVAEDYTTDKMAEVPDSIYSGLMVKEVSPIIINEFYEGKLEYKGLPNQFILLKNGKQSGIGRLIGGKLVPIKQVKDIMGISPRNLEQRLALDLLLDDKIKLVTIAGKAGGGKTLMAISSALHLMLKSNTYSRILVSRPIQPMGKDIGFLPGSLSEKLDPWMQPIYDNLELLLGPDRKMLDMYMDQGIIQVEALTYIRGRSIPNSFILVDEAQNLSPREIKTIITRSGENSKIVLTGDIEQIDNPYIDFASNGLTYVIEKLKKYDITGHVTLKRGERSELATLGAEVL